MPAKQGVFISYRRADLRDLAGRIADRLEQHDASDRVFLDRSDIPHGAEFKAVIEQRMAASHVVLVLIGKQWEGDGERRRLHEPNDFVRLEVAEALRSQARVIPVLVDREMPAASDLPPDVAKLTERNAFFYRSNADTRDLDALVSELYPKRARRGAVAAIVLSVIVIGGAGSWAASQAARAAAEEAAAQAQAQRAAEEAARKAALNCFPLDKIGNVETMTIAPKQADHPAAEQRTTKRGNVEWDENQWKYECERGWLVAGVKADGHGVIKEILCAEAGGSGRNCETRYVPAEPTSSSGCDYRFEAFSATCPANTVVVAVSAWGVAHIGTEASQNYRPAMATGTVAGVLCCER